MTKVKGEFVLALERTNLQPEYSVRIVPDFDSILSMWGAGVRTSPIFPLGDYEVPDLSRRSESLLCFLGPIYPADVPVGIPSFLTFGLFNILLVAQDPRTRKSLLQFLRKQSEIPWEVWKVASGKIKEMTYSPYVDAPNTNDNGAISVDSVLRSATDEYRALVATTISKGALRLPSVVDEIRSLDDGLRHQISMSPHHCVSKLQWLVNVNAALSRFSSQTFAGTSPISHTECHFWTHSLLGIGMASAALLTIRRHVHRAFAVCDFATRIQLLAKETAKEGLRGLPMKDRWWQQHHLPETPAGANVGNEKDRLPLIVCFSGRDGFRSTPFSLSAPLEVISACNTVGWSLLTLTHELSHVFIDSILAALLPKIKSKEGRTDLLRLLSKKTPANLFEQAQELLLLCISLIEREEADIPEDASLRIATEADLARIVQTHYQEINELLTHMFDFLYFYAGDFRAYVSSIWRSWDVIPNIQDRIDDYVTRTLCAVLCHNLTVDDPVGTTIDQVKAELDAVKSVAPDGQYIGEAIGRLTTERSRFEKRLHTRVVLTKFFRGFLYSPAIAKIINEEQPESGGAYKSLSPKSFTSRKRISNPLRFLQKFSGDKKADTGKSIWIIAQLAFASIDNDR